MNAALSIAGFIVLVLGANFSTVGLIEGVGEASSLGTG